MIDYWIKYNTIFKVIWNQLLSVSWYIWLLIWSSLVYKMMTNDDIEILQYDVQHIYNIYHHSQFDHGPAILSKCYAVASS